MSALRSTLRRTFIITGSIVTVIGYWGLANLQLTLNGSESLPDTAYVQWHWPQMIWRGAVVAVPPPAVFGDKFDGMSVVKRIGGLPGDKVENLGDRICIAGACYEGELRDGKPFAPLIESGTIPDGMIAIFGDAPNSFDSRYGVFGLIPEDQIEAVGVALHGFPHWTEVAKWLGIST